VDGLLEAAPSSNITRQAESQRTTQRLEGWRDIRPGETGRRFFVGFTDRFQNDFAGERDGVKSGKSNRLPALYLGRRGDNGMPERQEPKDRTDLLDWIRHARNELEGREAESIGRAIVIDLPVAGFESAPANRVVLSPASSTEWKILDEFLKHLLSLEPGLYREVREKFRPWDIKVIGDFLILLDHVEQSLVENEKWYSVDPPPDGWYQIPVQCANYTEMCAALGMKSPESVRERHKKGKICVLHPDNFWYVLFPLKALREAAQKRLAKWKAAQMEMSQKSGKVGKSRKKL